MGEHTAECRWESTTSAECEYRATHHYCPHAEHACDCTAVRHRAEKRIEAATVEALNRVSSERDDLQAEVRERDGDVIAMGREIQRLQSKLSSAVNLRDEWQKRFEGQQVIIDSLRDQLGKMEDGRDTWRQEALTNSHRLDAAYLALLSIRNTPPTELDGIDGKGENWWYRLVKDMRDQAAEAYSAAVVESRPDPRITHYQLHSCGCGQAFRHPSELKEHGQQCASFVEKPHRPSCAVYGMPVGTVVPPQCTCGVERRCSFEVPLPSGVFKCGLQNGHDGPHSLNRISVE